MPVLDKPNTETPVGTPFDWRDSTYFRMDLDGNGTTGALYDWMEYESRDLNIMIQRDHRASSIADVLMLPIIGAKGSFVAGKGDKGELADVQQRLQTPAWQGGMQTPLESVIGQMANSVIHKRSYHEKEQYVDKDGKISYRGLWWRPPSTCRLRFDQDTGARDGFEQDRLLIVNGLSGGYQDGMPKRIPEQLALIHTNGQALNPLTGTSDLEVPYWCWKTKAKIQFLWYCYLEGAALPFLHVTSSTDAADAQKVASTAARMRNSGVLGTSTDISINALDKSGKGSQQFEDAMKYLDSCAAMSVFAGFIDLSSAAGRGAGSLALSNDQTDFFFSMIQAKIKEIAYTITNEIAAPLVRWNFGVNATCPTWQFEPTEDADKAALMTMVGQMLVSPSLPPPPQSFLDGVITQSARLLNLDESAIEQDLNSAARKALVKASQDKAVAQSQPAQAAAHTAGFVGGAVDQIARAVNGQNPLGGQNDQR